ncbi:hypothetical protein DFJ63DRAFT_310513 [Scheffersomyces coipomensis]|uniref:uncharacterized protein n=1 Tax=Scheffersomyces coipomensis TaxID=1788519 RepID=UPI00315D9BE4
MNANMISEDEQDLRDILEWIEDEFGSLEGQTSYEEPDFEDQLSYDDTIPDNKLFYDHSIPQVQPLHEDQIPEQPFDINQFLNDSQGLSFYDGVETIRQNLFEADGSQFTLNICSQDAINSPPHDTISFNSIFSACSTTLAQNLSNNSENSTISLDSATNEVLSYKSTSTQIVNSSSFKDNSFLDSATSTVDALSYNTNSRNVKISIEHSRENQPSAHSTSPFEDFKVEGLNPSNERFKVVDDRYVKINPKEKVTCLTCNKIEYSKEYKGTIIKKENLEFNHVYGDQSKIDPRLSCSQTRTKYERFIDEIQDSITNITYVTNAEFNDLHPYEPQHVRYEIREDGSLNRGTTSGLCPYCEEIKFLPFKNSSYLSHLSLEHGIFATGYLVPEPQVIDEDGTTRRKVSLGSNVTPDVKNQVLCPVCGYVILTNCWRTKENPFLSYYRHFKEKHNRITSNLRQKVNQQAPLRNRGRNIKPLEGSDLETYIASAKRRRLENGPNLSYNVFPRNTR